MSSKLFDMENKICSLLSVSLDLSRAACSSYMTEVLVVACERRNLPLSNHDTSAKIEMSSRVRRIATFCMYRIGVRWVCVPSEVGVVSVRVS